KKKEKIQKSDFSNFSVADVMTCNVYKDPPLWFLQRLWYLQSARYAQDGAKLNAGRWQNGANRDLHHHRRAKHTPRQGDRPLLRRPPTPPHPPRRPSTALATGRHSAHHHPPPSSPPGPPAPVTGHSAPLSATPPASPSWAIASKGSNEGGCQPRPCAGAT